MRLYHLAVILAAGFLLSSMASSPLAAQPAKTPRPGSLERKQILDAIRPAPNSQIRFVVHRLRVVKGQGAAFAYAAVEPSRQEYDGGEYVLQRDDRTGAANWRIIWAVTGGGANACADIADYYQSLTRHLTKYRVAANALNPRHAQEAAQQAAAAAADQDCSAVGDLGPDLGD